MNENNPLVKFQRDLTRSNVGKKVNNWKLLSELTGLHLQTIISIARLDYSGVLRMSLGTYLKLKDTINVDMLSFGKVDDQRINDR